MKATRRVALAMGFWASTALATGGLATPAAAQVAQPAEQPPLSYEGTQYVDSEGCAFIRAGISGTVNWVPRLSRDRGQLCGFEPSLAGGPVSAPAVVAPSLAGVPNPLDTPVPGLPPIEEEVPTPVAVAEAPMAAPGPARPRVSPSPTVVAEAPPLPPAFVAPVEPRRLTLADACRGLTGVQDHIRDGLTGAAVDCGVGAAPAAAPVAEPRRLTLAAICADVAATGRSYVYRDSGAPVACEARPGAVASVPATMRPAVPVAPVAIAAAGACSLGVVGGGSSIGSAAAVRCGPQIESPSGVIRATLAAGSVSRVEAVPEVTRQASSPALAALPALRSPVPASNPIGLASVATAPVRGYEHVWDDGRINVARGLPQAIAGAVVIGSETLAPGVVTIPVPVEPAVAPVAAQGVLVPTVAPAQVPAVAAVHVTARGPRPAALYVQVGAFGDATNAQRAVATLAAMGLPVGVAQGRGLQAVAAGPFGSVGEAQAALSQARAAGYGDAVLR